MVDEINEQDLLDTAAHLVEQRQYRQAIGMYEHFRDHIKATMETSTFQHTQTLRLQLADVYNTLGALCEITGEYADAFQYVSRAAVICPENAAIAAHLAMLGLHTMAICQTRLNLVLGLLTYAISKAKSKQTEAHCLACRCAVAHALRDWSGAISDGIRAKALGPKLVTALVVLADTYKSTSRMESGTLYMNAIEIDDRAKACIGRGFALDRVDEILKFFRMFWPAWVGRPRPSFTYKAKKSHYVPDHDIRSTSCPVVTTMNFLQSVHKGGESLPEPDSLPMNRTTPFGRPNTSACTPKPARASSSVLAASQRLDTPRRSNHSPQKVLLPFIPVASPVPDSRSQGRLQVGEVPVPHGATRQTYEKPWSSPRPATTEHRKSPHRFKSEKLNFSPARSYRKPWQETPSSPMTQCTPIPAQDSPRTKAVTPLDLTLDASPPPLTADNITPPPPDTGSIRLARVLAETVARASPVLAVKVKGDDSLLDGTRTARVAQRREMELLKRATSEYLSTLTPRVRPAQPVVDASTLGHSPRVPRQDDRQAVNLSPMYVGYSRTTRAGGLTDSETESEEETARVEASAADDTVINLLAASLIKKAPELMPETPEALEPVEDARVDLTPTLSESQIRLIDVPRPCTADGVQPYSLTSTLTERLRGDSPLVGSNSVRSFIPSSLRQTPMSSRVAGSPRSPRKPATPRTTTRPTRLSTSGDAGSIHGNTSEHAPSSPFVRRVTTPTLVSTPARSTSGFNSPRSPLKGSLSSAQMAALNQSSRIKKMGQFR
ncbi:hypothetical protein J8273_6874 [Carpediemonas membranifera]|uniref:Tetratricopeptide repeat protein n=1 Tax=Carpediemonas membranifera TaxID=201153 RepID=A0A8J6AQT4_9EUKA|nr:hypothetical protein J8273_6874 [Carpediemonas membranifera]|eukprot:KAG9391861.1 hypothetical protein J8273_6874 [Carpediemonas membranifera]